MNILGYTHKSAESILQELGSTPAGISSTEAKHKREKYGRNILAQKQTTWLHILLRQFHSPFLYMLIGASILSFTLGEVIDSMLIMGFVLLDTGLGFYQEYKSEQTLRLLKKFITVKTKVIRDGHESLLESADLVPRDIVLLEAGDIVPADLRLLETTNLTVDESILTGEAVEVIKSTQALARPPKQLYQATNICFSGTTISEGRARGVVLKTGSQTTLGEITNLTVETERISSFEKGINRFSSFILKLIMGTLVCIVLINLFMKGPDKLPTILIFSVALAVSVIPETLPVVMTFSLSRGALDLAKKKVVVKRLSAIEDLGSIEILCTDKTGTLTENVMKLDTVYPVAAQNVVEYAMIGATISNVKNKSVHSFDTAIEESLPSDTLQKIHALERLKELPFDPARKRNSVLVKRNSTYELVVRGAPEVILELSNHMSPYQRRQIQNWIKEQGITGKRVIAVAAKEIPSEYIDLQEEEKKLTFIGMISFVDPIKFTTAPAVRKATELEVQLKILTGDSREVAGAVAHKIGIVSDPEAVMTGDELESLPFEKQRAAVHDYHIFARVSPKQKHMIIHMLQERFEVGFLGEGVNDAPALKIANVALVVDGATDIAREAADIILRKKSLETIVEGIKEGRCIFANTAKYIKATLSSNFGNFYTVALASLFIDFLPLLPVQILLINLLTDFPMIAVATDNVDAQELHSPRQYDIKDIALFGTLLGVVSSIFDCMFFLLFYTISPAVLQTNWSIGSILTELVFLFSIRTRLPVLKAQLPSLPIIVLSCLAASTAIVLPFTAFGQSVFRFTPPSVNHLIGIASLTGAYFIATEGVKQMYYTFAQNHTSRRINS